MLYYGTQSIFRFSSAVSKKLDKDRKRRTSTSYIPDNGSQSGTKSSQRQSIEETAEEGAISALCDGVDDLQVTVNLSDDVFEA